MKARIVVRQFATSLDATFQSPTLGLEVTRGSLVMALRRTSLFFGDTHHTCSDVCVWVTVWHGKVLPVVCENHQSDIPCCFLRSSIQLECCPSLALPTVCLPRTTHPVLGFLCLWAVVTATGLAPLTIVGSTLGYGGAGCTPVGGVVLLMGKARVASGPVVLGGLCTCYQ